MDENRIEATLSIDMKKYRLRIYKSTLNLLGPPKHIQLLVSPKEKVIAIRGLENRCKESHKVSFTHMKPDNSYELYSKELVMTLMSLIPDLEKNITYRLTGEVHIEQKIVFFPLDTIQRVEGGI